MTAAFAAGLVAGLGIAVPVGAVGAHLVALTARTSLRTGVCAALGVACADGLYALLATAGGAALADVVRPVPAPLRQASAAVLAAPAVRGAVTAPRRYRGSGAAVRAVPPAPGPGRAFLGMLGLTLLNPATVVCFAALLLGGAGAGDGAPAARRALFVTAAFLASAGWQMLLTGGGALLGRALTGRRGRLMTALVSSAVITALAVRTAWPP